MSALPNTKINNLKILGGERVATIKINISGVIGTSPLINNGIAKVSSARGRMSNLRSQVDGRIRSRYNINSRFNNVIRSLESIEYELQQIRSVVEKGAGDYQNTENSLTSQIRGMNLLYAKSYLDGNMKPFHFDANNHKFNLDGSNSNSGKGQTSPNGSSNNNSQSKNSKGSINKSLKVTSGTFKYKDDKALKDLKKKNVKFKDYVYDKKTGQFSIPELTKYAQQKGTISELKQEGKVEVNLVDLENSIKGKYGYGNSSIKVGTAEAHESISAGLYVYDKSGNAKLAPAVNAELGASASVITIKESGRIGLGESYNMLGAYANGEASAGKVEAKVKATASIFDEDGSVNIQAYEKASAEAIAVEAKGSAGVSLLGTDLGLTGGVNIGIGAHAEAGIIDGKVKVDIGASLGVGANLGFEVDPSGTVDAICDGAASLIDDVSELF